MSARAERRPRLTRERLIVILLIALAVIVVATAAGLFFKGSLTLDNLLVELGLKEPPISMEEIPGYSGDPYVILNDN